MTFSADIPSSQRSRSLVHRPPSPLPSSFSSGAAPRSYHHCAELDEGGEVCTLQRHRRRRRARAWLLAAASIAAPALAAAASALTMAASRVTPQIVRCYIFKATGYTKLEKIRLGWRARHSSGGCISGSNRPIGVIQTAFDASSRCALK